MIKNEKQYNISKKKLLEVAEKIDGINGVSKNIDSKRALIVMSLQELKNGLEDEIAAYEALRFGKLATLKERSISELPNFITEYKIANNLTNKEFSMQLGLKEQQLQRYESEGFKSVSFQKLVKFINIINLDLKIKASRLKRDTIRKSTLQP